MQGVRWRSRLHGLLAASGREIGRLHRFHVTRRPLHEGGANSGGTGRRNGPFTRNNGPRATNDTRTGRDHGANHAGGEKGREIEAAGPTSGGRSGQTGGSGSGPTAGGYKTGGADQARGRSGQTGNTAGGNTPGGSSGQGGNPTGGKSGSGNARRGKRKGGEGEGFSKGLSQLQRALSVVENSIGKEMRGLHKGGSDFPETVALPIDQRPLFPGFYRAITVADPETIEALRSTLQKGKPYVSVFLARNGHRAVSLNTASRQRKGSSHVVDDVLRIRSPSDIHKVGVFSQIHNMIAGPNQSVTLLLFPLQRVKYRELKIRSFTVLDTDDNPLRELKTRPSAALDTVDGQDEDDSQSVSREPAEVREKDSEEGRASPTREMDSKRDRLASLREKHTRGDRDGDTSSDLPPVSVVVEALRDETTDTGSFDQYRDNVKSLLDTINEITRLNPLVREQAAEFMRAVGTVGDIYNVPGKLADFAAAMSDASPEELQRILECVDIKERLERSLMLLKRELLNAELQSRVSKDLERQIGDRDREFFLKERLKMIQTELGMETNSKEKVVEKYQKRAAKVHMSDTAKKVFDEEIGKLLHLRPSAQEYNLTTTYLDWLTNVPWGIRSEENFNIHHAQTVLDDDHYGLKDVKERILEFIAVGKMRGTVQGKIICLSGPPGVGKTSIGKSIARALDRKFFRFSVGGLYDVAEIKGHRRTYVGAMPGKMVQALKNVQSENPLILIDEIDKIGRGGHNGDPSSALLEVLDPEQNNSFLDHYLDVPIDLSRVLFVCTANDLETIPGPLLDRMEVIPVSGYIAEEKQAIASKYLIPDALEATGLQPGQMVFPRETIDHILHHYCRESGVRNLKKQIEKICRKAALKLVRDEPEESATAQQEATENATAQQEQTTKSMTMEVLPIDLREYLGNPLYLRDRLYDRTPNGVIMGLAYNQLGGSALYIESASSSAGPRERTDVAKDSVGGIFPTGNIGSVMKESTDIAYSYACSLMRKRFPENRFFNQHSVHLHVPEGAIPKDGPSAGIAMCSSLLSLALDRPAALDVAMTGELTLSGRVLKIGGVKEKMMAAKRTGVKHVILPAGNKPDYEELEGHIKEGLQGHFVETYDEVFDLLFPVGEQSA